MGSDVLLRPGPPGKTRSPETKRAAVDLDDLRTKTAFRSSTLTTVQHPQPASMKQSMVFNDEELGDLQMLRKPLEFKYNGTSMVLRINAIVPFEIIVDYPHWT